MTDQPGKPAKVTELEARTAFLALGPARTLAGLRSSLGDRTVSQRTLETWSAKHSWIALALEHDTLAAAKAGKLVADAQGKDLASLDITPAKVLEEIRRIGFANLGDFIEVQSDGSAVIDLTLAKERPDLMAAVSEIIVEEYTEGGGENARNVKRVKLKLHPKLPALEKLGEWLALWKGNGAAPAPKSGNTTIVNVNGDLVLVKQVHAELDDIFGGSVIDNGAPALASPNPTGSGRVLSENARKGGD